MCGGGLCGGLYPTHYAECGIWRKDSVRDLRIGPVRRPYDRVNWLMICSWGDCGIKRVGMQGVKRGIFLVFKSFVNKQLCLCIRLIFE